MNPSSLDDERARRGNTSKSARPKVQISSKSSRLYVKVTRQGGGRRYLRNGYGRAAEKTKAIVKTSFIRRGPDAGRHIAQYIDYMMKKNIDKEREPEERSLFDRNGRELSRDEGIELARRNRGSEIAGHKIILSPGNNNVDLIEYTQDQMKVLEDRFNADLHYSFVFQKNTDHHHIHVLLSGKAERRQDFALDGDTQTIDIRLDRNDFAAMREAGDRFLSREMYLDRSTDKRVRDDLLRDEIGSDALKKKYAYDREVNRDLGINVSKHDLETLKFLGLDTPYTFYEPENDRNKQKHENHNRGNFDSEKGRHDSKDYIAESFLHKDMNFDIDWSDREIARILDVADRDVEKIFPSAYEVHKTKVNARAEEFEHIKADPRNEKFFNGIQLLSSLQKEEAQYDRFMSGDLKTKETHFPERDLGRFLDSPEGEDVFNAFRLHERAAKEPGSMDDIVFASLDQFIDIRVETAVERVSRKFDFDQGTQVDEKTIEERNSYELGEEIVQQLSERNAKNRETARTLSRPNANRFCESFERLVRLDDGEMPSKETLTKEERIAYLANKLSNPEYAEYQGNIDLLKQKGFQLYSSYSTREELAETKTEIRKLQFELDSKVFEQSVEKYTKPERTESTVSPTNADNASREFEDVEKEREEVDVRRALEPRAASFHSSADTNSILYKAFAEAGNDYRANDFASKFHQAVMKFDDETNRREEFRPPQIEKTELEKGLRSEDELSPSKLLEREDEQEKVRGESLPLPGYDLDRLTRDDGEELLHDPTEVSVQIKEPDFDYPEPPRKRTEEDER